MWGGYHGAGVLPPNKRQPSLFGTGPASGGTGQNIEFFRRTWGPVGRSGFLDDLPAGGGGQGVDGVFEVAVEGDAVPAPLVPHPEELLTPRRLCPPLNGCLSRRGAWRLILVRVQAETNNPGPGTDAPHPVLVRSQPWQARFQGSHHPGHV